jgi:hypothetical protein
MATWQINESLIFLFYGFLAIYILICIYQAVFRYRVSGLSLNLLFSLEVAILAAILEYAFVYKINLFLDSDLPIIPAQKTRLMTYGYLA